MKTRAGALCAAAVVLSLAAVAWSPLAGGSSAPSANRGAVRAIAQAINLRGSDLPGWTETPNPPNATVNAYGSKVAACEGRPAADAPLAAVTSSRFSKGPVQLFSGVDIVRSHAQALGDTQNVKSARDEACFNKFINLLFKKLVPAGYHMQLSRIAQVVSTPTVALPDGVEVRFRFTLDVSGGGQKASIPATITVIHFVVGQAEISLEEIEMSAPVSVPIESTLLETLEARANDASAL